ncbi:uncharacterized protein TRUGW13939_01898 [Talaromyces rugulosus]|uniref:Rhodopsin domain-containing protein n=1 Tax=Talaromyces rugulosus TaxID=121627 RepID=A0A7H8QLJ4_TALRU|nr:uncharacterized protein TRUGW13939_01898 [Talaromyces rugulosus]QKX54809.1 hypothetical protein TRUGW13939_01898 [Talaromyces rugulosus]
MVKIYSVDSFKLVYREIIASSFLVSIASLALFLRLAARWAKRIRLWWDDYTIIAVWIILWAMFVIQIKYAQYGSGDQMTTIPPDNVILMLKILPGFQLLWGTAMSLAKFSYMFFYLSVFKASERFRRLTFGCMTIVALWWIANVFQIFLICRPFKMNWDSTAKGTCGNRPLTYALVGAVNIATDITTLLLPVPTVWSLQMPKRFKVGITAIFCIGLLITIISIIRMQSLIVLSFTEISSSMVDPVFWTVVEPSLAVTNACLPIIRPIIAIILPGHFFSSAQKTPKRGQGSGSGSTREFRNIEEDGGNYPLSPLNAGMTTSHVVSDQKTWNNVGGATAAAAMDTDDDSQRRISNENTGPLGRITRTTEWEVQR